MAHLPSSLEVATSLTKTLRREVNVAPTAARNNLLRFFGLYSPASDAPAFVCVEADLAFAAFAGSAFSMIPADAARDCIKEKDLGEFVQDNFGEVLNILSRLFSHLEEGAEMVAAATYQGAERRSPNRATNVTRPGFAGKARAQGPAPARSPSLRRNAMPAAGKTGTDDDDWQTF